MDLIMGRFADAMIERLSAEDLDAFERLMDAPDPDVYRWIAGGEIPPPSYDSVVFRRLREFHGRGGNIGDRR